jgi:hypothetical protein
MVGTFEEVLCEGNWSGSESGSLWNGSCMANATTGLWPEVGCGNHGTENSFACAEMRFLLMFTLRIPTLVSRWQEILYDGKSCPYYGRIQMSEDGLRTRVRRESGRVGILRLYWQLAGSILSLAFSTQLYTS